MSGTHFEKYKPAIFLTLLTAGALLLHGYHPFAEDAEIYLPGVEAKLNPNLFPMGREFFASHASLTLFPNLVAFSLRALHLRLEVGLFLWHVASIFLLLLACWRLTGLCFSTALARWGGVCLIAALFTLPVAGTALYIMDQYLNPRNLAAFAGIFAIAGLLEKKYLRMGLWLVFAGAVHPLMAFFAFSFCALFLTLEKFGANQPVVALLLPFGLSFAPASPAYTEAARFHGFHYILNWQWYEWVGILAPVVLFWWFGRIARSRHLLNLERMCRALIVYDLIYFALALVISVPKRFESLARIQPLRSLHLLYILMLVFMGGLIAEYILKNRVWRWLAFFLPLCAGMFSAQLALFPASAHVEWPWNAPRNEWAQAFLWVRQTTPVDAVFAVDPLYIQIPGEDTVGFRALAQRSRLADAVKDSGAVSMFPPLAEEWLDQFDAQRDWKHFTGPDFVRLHEKYGVTWIVLQQPGIAGLTCPYVNHTVMVCRVGP
jgi:hypothetical protein